MGVGKRDTLRHSIYRCTYAEARFGLGELSGAFNVCSNLKTVKSAKEGRGQLSYLPYSSLSPAILS